MRRRTFLSTLPAGALLAGPGAATAGARPATAATATATAQTRPADPHAGVGPGNRNSGVQFVSRSTVWGAHGAAATAHPRATLIGIDTLRRGGSAIDAAIAINAA
ncbi:MAG: gamma-glutamyltransferase, partial [Brevundimonas sp.]